MLIIQRLYLKDIKNYIFKNNYILLQYYKHFIHEF
mgnify:CR=1 FL=1